MQRLITYRRGFSAMLVRLTVAALTLTFATFAMADPPMRVARLGYLSGAVTFSPAGENDWVSGTLNRPLVTGDRLWADKSGRVELQIGNAVVRLSSSTLFTLTNLDDSIAQMHLEDGTLQLRVRRVDRNQVIEVDTPNLAFVITQPGEYRITVNADADSTEVITRSGRANVYDAGASYSIATGRGYRFFGAGLSDYDVLNNPRPDAFDRWAQGRDRGYDTSIAARYVSRDVIGYQDLDQYGSWSSVPEYGNVWMPTRVAADWAPYRDGHWSWIEPWGWTWVDDQPWGFTVSHYGRWTNTSRGWGWVPGPIAARPVYAPALVAFIGGSNFQVSVSNGGGNVGAVGWFPLGPREVYRPAYAVSRSYFTNVNISNTVINNTIIVNNYDNRNAPTANDTVYANRAVRGAVVTVPTVAFVQSQPVARAQLRVTEAALMQAPVHSLAVIAPQRVSVLGAAPEQQRPPQVVERRVVAQSLPPAPVVGFAVRQRALVANPGKPVEAAALAALKPTAPPVTAAPPAAREKPGAVPPTMSSLPLSQPRVEIVKPGAIGQAASAPPPLPPTKERSDRRTNAGQPPVAEPTSRDPNPVVTPGQALPPKRQEAPVVPVAPVAQEPTKPGNRGADRRGQPAVTPPASGNPPAPVQAPAATNLPTPAKPVQPVAPAPVAPAPVAQPPAPRGPGAMPQQLPPSEQRGKPPEQREAPNRPPSSPPAATERAPLERPLPQPPRGRPERPEAVKPAPAAPVVPLAPAAVKAPEPPKAVSPLPKAEVSEPKPRVVVEKKDDKRIDKKDDKKDEKQDKEDDEKKRK